MIRAYQTFFEVLSSKPQGEDSHYKRVIARFRYESDANTFLDNLLRAVIVNPSEPANFAPKFETRTVKRKRL